MSDNYEQPHPFDYDDVDEDAPDMTGMELDDE